MDDSRIDRSFLETLSSAELSHLADRYGIDIPPGLERIFIIEELLDILDEDDTAGAGEPPPPLREAVVLEPVSLPKQYNITFIEVMIRDPLWAFAFWEVKSYDRESHERAPDFEGYHLRVCPAGGGRGEDSFTVPVGIEDNAWYLSFPPPGGRYRVALCVQRGEAEIVLAQSRPFSLPELFEFPPAAEQGGQNPLVYLAGAEDFPVLRNVERFPRTLKRQADTDG